MSGPKRGEIWRVRIQDPATGREREGSEIRGNKKGERLCLIVSANGYNDGCYRLTVSPLTKYTINKEDSRHSWAVTIQCSEDIIVDRSNKTYGDEKLLLERTLKNKYGKIIQVPFKSIIDCGQLYTLYSTPPASLAPLPKDVRWDRRCGELKENSISNVDLALQVLLSSDIRYNKPDLLYRQGHIIIVNLPGGLPKPCLVVSSSGVDAVRQRTPYPQWGYLEQCTIVPLEPASQDEVDETERGIALVKIHAYGNQIVPERALAMCQEVLTIDWRRRKVVGPVGEVSHMDGVGKALRNYLGLPC